MAEDLTHHFWVDTSAQEECGQGVAKITQADVAGQFPGARVVRVVHAPPVASLSLRLPSATEACLFAPEPSCLGRPTHLAVMAVWACPLVWASPIACARNSEGVWLALRQGHTSFGVFIPKHTAVYRTGATSTRRCRSDRLITFFTPNVTVPRPASSWRPSSAAPSPRSRGHCGSSYSPFAAATARCRARRQSAAANARRRRSA